MPPLKHYLLTPGPTPVPERVALAMAQPIPHHRAPAFEALFAEVREGLKWIYGTQGDVLTFACFRNRRHGGRHRQLLASAGDEIATVNGGKFGERWGKIAKAYGLKAHELKVEWGKAVEPAVVEKALQGQPGHPRSLRPGERELHRRGPPGARRSPRITAPTPGALHRRCRLGAGRDAAAHGRVGHRRPAHRLAEGAHAAARARLRRRQREGLEANETATLPRFYFDWKRERENQRKNQTAWTPAISLMMGLAEVFAWLREQTLPAVYARHERLAKASRAAMVAIGCKLFAERPVVSLTTVVSPEGIDSDKLVKTAQDQVRRDAGRRPGRGQGQDLPHRPPRLLRRPRHRGGGRGHRARARRPRLQEVPLGTGVGAAMKVMGEFAG